MARSSTIPPAPSPAVTAAMAREARALVARSLDAAMATHNAAGTPFATLVEYATGPSGAPLLCLSDLAEHTKNLAYGTRISLLVVDAEGNGPSLARSRVTLVGTLSRAADDDEAALKETFATRLPHARSYVDLGGFHMYRLAVEEVRLVQGFGRMGWVSGGDYATSD